jgi:hypothetical protein
MIIFNPDQVNKLDHVHGVKATHCAWGHSLVGLAKLLATKRGDFDLSAEINVPCLVLKMPMKLLAAFELFDPFFSELRYPMELKQLEGVSEEEGRVLNAVVEYLHPFLSKIA